MTLMPHGNKAATPLVCIRRSKNTVQIGKKYVHDSNKPQPHSDTFRSCQKYATIKNSCVAKVCESSKNTSTPLPIPRLLLLMLLSSRKDIRTRTVLSSLGSQSPRECYKGTLLSWCQSCSCRCSCSCSGCCSAASGSTRASLMSII